VMELAPFMGVVQKRQSDLGLDDQFQGAKVFPSLSLEGSDHRFHCTSGSKVIGSTANDSLASVGERDAGFVERSASLTERHRAGIVARTRAGRYSVRYPTKKRSVVGSGVSLCPGSDSNTHAVCTAGDFESDTEAFRRNDLARPLLYRSGQSGTLPDRPRHSFATRFATRVLCGVVGASSVSWT
jgi:hypothetical protein